MPASQAAFAPRGVVMRALDRLDLSSELWAVRAAHPAALAEELVQLLP
jgi:hypothetical protein